MLLLASTSSNTHMCKHKLRMRGEKRRSVQMKLNGGTRNQHSPCLLLAAGVWLEHLRLHCPSVNSTPVMLDASACTPRTVNVICNLGFELRILTRAVKSLHGFDSPNGGEHYTKPPICTRDLHNAVTFFSFTSSAVSDSLYDPQRTFSRKKNYWKTSSKVSVLFRKVFSFSEKLAPKYPFDSIPFAET